jgi:hypothetical protein
MDKTDYHFNAGCKNALPGDQPLLISVDSQKRISRSTIFATCLSGVGFPLFMGRFIAGITVTVRPEIPIYEMSLSFCMYCLFFGTQILRLIRLNAITPKVYIRLLTVFSLVWLIFNLLFYFSSSPTVIVLYALLIFAGMLLHPEFPKGHRERFRVYFCQLSPSICIVKQRLNDTRRVTTYFFKLPIRFMRAINESLKTIRLYYYSEGEALFLLYISLISFLCLFTILGKFFIAVIIIVFCNINMMSIKNFKPLKGYKYIEPRNRSKWNPQPMANYYAKSMLDPLGIFHGFGTVALIGVYLVSYKYLKLPLPFQLSVWGVCLWNLIMGELQLYARTRLEEIKSQFNENGCGSY